MTLKLSLISIAIFRRGFFFLTVFSKRICFLLNFVKFSKTSFLKITSYRSDYFLKQMTFASTGFYFVIAEPL